MAEETSPTDRPSSTPRSRTRGAVAAGHPRTVAAAQAALEAGGNAFDAIVAGAFTACVAEPVLASLGGGAFLVARPASGPARVYDFFVQTPLVRRPTAELEFERVTVPFGAASQDFHVGFGSVATPGMVRGLLRAHRDLGRMPLREVVEPAIRAARDGLEVNRFQGHLLAITAPIYLRAGEARATYESRREPGTVVQVGEVLAQPALGNTIEQLAREGDDAFYRGELAALLARESQANGGHIGLGDLASYEVVVREPLALRYRDASLLLNPPPSSGGALVGIGLRLLEPFELRALGARTARCLELLARTMEQTALGRARSLVGHEQEPGIAARFLAEPSLGPLRAALEQGFHQSRGTTHLSVIDADGNAAAMTTSNGEGSGRLVPGAGVMLNNMLGEDDLNPLGFHQWPTGARISSMMAPTIAERGGELLATGSGGSKRIRSCVLQILVSLLDLGLPLGDAVDGPRIHWDDDLLAVEGGLPDAVVAELAKRVGPVQQWEGRDLYFGGAHTVRFDQGSGQFDAAGDGRRGGAAAIVS